MNVYLVSKNSSYRFLIDPAEADLEGAEVLVKRENVSNLYQAGFSMIHTAIEKIYIDCQHRRQLDKFNKLADLFELDVPGVLMFSWQFARSYATSEFVRNAK